MWITYTGVRRGDGEKSNEHPSPMLHPPNNPMLHTCHTGGVSMYCSSCISLSHPLGASLTPRDPTGGAGQAPQATDIRDKRPAVLDSDVQQVWRTKNIITALWAWLFFFFFPFFSPQDLLHGGGRAQSENGFRRK